MNGKDEKPPQEYHEEALEEVSKIASDGDILGILCVMIEMPPDVDEIDSAENLEIYQTSTLGFDKTNEIERYYISELLLQNTEALINKRRNPTAGHPKASFGDLIGILGFPSSKNFDDDFL